jgi:hypothetical protein
MTDLILPRRRFLAGLVGLVAAPMVVRAAARRTESRNDRFWRDLHEYEKVFNEMMSLPPVRYVRKS